MNMTENKGRFQAGENHPMHGKHYSPETISKRSGVNHHNYGKHWSPEIKAKMSASHKGKQAGEENPMFGRTGDKCVWYGRHHTPDTKKKISNSHLGEKNPFYGKKHTLETKQQISLGETGEKNPTWRGGISFEPYCPKFNKEFRVRVREFFEFQCVMCGISELNNERKLSVHHVEYDKTACCHGKPVTFVPLCKHCHSRTNRGDRARWEAMLHRCIDEMWGGRSYYTKEEYAALCRAV